MAKRLPYTPRSRVKSVHHQLWLRSRERNAAIKREGGCCQACGRKASQANGKEVTIEVHHVHGVQWETLIDLVYKHLLCDPKNLKVLCKECHSKLHEDESNEQQ